MFATTVYWKPTFAELYVHWNSFCSKQRKINLIKILVNFALVIGSKTKLEQELEFIKKILGDNDHPLDIVQLYLC